MHGSDRTDSRLRPRHRPRLLFAIGAVAVAAGWLSLRAAPPLTGRAMFGLWRLPDFAVACVALSVVPFALCRSRRAVLRLALACGAGTFAWLGLEAVFLTLTGAGAAKPIGEVPVPHCDIEGLTAPDIAVAFGLPCQPIRFHYTTNAHGHRNPPDRDDGTVYCVGDSCLVGAVLDWTDTIVHRLECLVGQRCVNVALIGLAPQEAEAEFAHAFAGQDLHGRVVLQFLCEDNDLLDSARVTRPEAAPPPSLWERSLLHRLAVVLQRLTQPVVAESGRRTAVFGDTPVRFLWLHHRGDECEQQWANIERSLDRFRAAVAAAGGAFGVVLIPQKLRVLGPYCRFPPGSDLLPLADRLTPMPGQLAEWSRRAGVAILDLTGALQSAAANGRLVWLADDTHWNAAGAETAASAVAAWPWLRQQLAQPSK